jgi:hypothetical protein
MSAPSRKLGLMRPDREAHRVREAVGELGRVLVVARGTAVHGHPFSLILQPCYGRLRRREAWDS